MKSYKERSIQELKSLQKTITALVIMMFIVFIAMLVMATIKSNTTLFVIPVSLLPIAFLNLNSLREIKRELELRKSGNNENE